MLKRINFECLYGPTLASKQTSFNVESLGHGISATEDRMCRSNQWSVKALRALYRCSITVGSKVDTRPEIIAL